MNTIFWDNLYWDAFLNTEKTGAFNIWAQRTSFTAAMVFMLLLWVVPYLPVDHNIIWHIAIFIGNVICPIFMAYSHLGIRQFALNRWNIVKIQFAEMLNNVSNENPTDFNQSVTNQFTSVNLMPVNLTRNWASFPRDLNTVEITNVIQDECHQLDRRRSI